MDYRPLGKTGIELSVLGFGCATLGDIYGDELEQCLTLSCNELRHVWFENVDGTFRAHALPRRAQLSTGFGVLADPLGPDRVALQVSHNFFSPEPETGRTDGGLGAWMVFEDGDCVATEPLDARFGDHRGLLRALDASGGVHVVHLRNDDRHSVSAMRRDGGLTVRLAGPPGNPTGIGGKVTWTSPQGASRVRHVVAGDGYLTQSSAALSFPGRGGALEVRWPDGHVTTHELTGDEPSVTLRP